MRHLELFILFIWEYLHLYSLSVIWFPTSVLSVTFPEVFEIEHSFSIFDIYHARTASKVAKNMVNATLFDKQVAERLHEFSYAWAKEWPHFRPSKECKQRQVLSQERQLLSYSNSRNEDPHASWLWTVFVSLLVPGMHCLTPRRREGEVHFRSPWQPVVSPWSLRKSCSHRERRSCGICSSCLGPTPP